MTMRNGVLSAFTSVTNRGGCTTASRTAAAAAGAALLAAKKLLRVAFLFAMAASLSAIRCGKLLEGHGVILSCAVFAALSTNAVIVAVTSALPGFPLIENVAVFAPAGICTSAGTTASG